MGLLTTGMGMGTLMSTTASKLGMIQMGEAISDTLTVAQMDAKTNQKGNGIAGQDTI